MAILNQYSYVVVAALLGVILAVVLWRWARIPPNGTARIGVLIVYALLATGLGLALRYPAGETLTLDRVEAALASDRPTFLMLYSNY